MFKTSFLIMSFSLPCQEVYFQNKYAETVPYEDLYIVQEPPNKSTIDFNCLTTEEMVREQNIKIINKLFEEEIKNPHEFPRTGH